MTDQTRPKGIGITALDMGDATEWTCVMCSQTKSVQMFKRTHRHRRWTICRDCSALRHMRRNELDYFLKAQLSGGASIANPAPADASAGESETENGTLV